MPRELFELRILGQESRTLLYAIRKLKGRFRSSQERTRYRTRVTLLQSRLSEVAKGIRVAMGITPAQVIQIRRDLTGIHAAIREILRLTTGKDADPARPGEPLPDGSPAAAPGDEGPDS